MLLPTLSAPMPFQMAMDEILFRQMERKQDSESLPIFRFYYASEPWVTVGYSQTASLRGGPSDRRSNPEIASAASRPRNDSIPACRRITGGGIVKHGKDLIFSVIARKKHHEAFHSVRISYLKIHEAVKHAYEQLGCSPRFYRCDEKLEKGDDCFTFPIATDLGINNNKIAGGAQKRSAGTLLHQESLMVSKEIEMNALCREIRAGFEQVFSANLKESILDPEVLITAKRLAAEKYKDF